MIEERTDYAERLLVEADELLACIADSEGSWRHEISGLREAIDAYLRAYGWVRNSIDDAWMQGDESRTD